MANDTLQEWVTWSFSPTISAIIVTLLVSLSLPILIHLYLYQKGASATVPSFLLLGPSGAGKTTLLTLFEQGAPTPTHTSQAPQTVSCTLPSGKTAASAQYRAQDDPSAKTDRKLEITDTPGHGKLRHHATTVLSSPIPPKGLIFVVDSAALSSSSGLTEAATYLHDILLMLQKRHTSSKTSKGPSSIPVLVAANKLDLFTALPAQLVKKNLQDEITKLRATRSKGLLDSGAGMDDDSEEREWLGEGGEGIFAFSQMEEAGVDVAVIGGNAIGEAGEKGHVDEWWAWIAQQM